MFHCDNDTAVTAFHEDFSKCPNVNVSYAIRSLYVLAIVSRSLLSIFPPGPTVVLLTHYLVFSSTVSAALRPTQIITLHLFQYSTGNTSSEGPLLLLTVAGSSTLPSTRADAHALCLTVNQQHPTAIHLGLLLFNWRTAICKYYVLPSGPHLSLLPCCTLLFYIFVICGAPLTQHGFLSFTSSRLRMFGIAQVTTEDTAFASMESPLPQTLEFQVAGRKIVVNVTSGRHWTLLSQSPDNLWSDSKKQSLCVCQSV